MEQTQTQFKKYFLGNLSADEIDAVEMQILESEEFAEQLRIVETDLIEEYIDGELSTDDKKSFETNYLNSEPRLKKVEFLKSIKKFAKSQNRLTDEPKPSFFENLKTKFSLRPLTLAFGTIALICAVGITSYFVWKNSTNKSEVLISLNKVYKNERPLDSRVSGFEYAPKIEGTRGTNDKTNDELDFVELSAKTTAKQNATAENLHALGQVYLTKKDFDKAIEQFEKAIKQNPNISKLHNDLGVALLEKGKLAKSKCEEKTKQKLDCDNEKEPYLLILGNANKEFSKAIELDNTSLEATFNQALSIQSITPNQAKEAWENYLKLDSTSKWADEARRNIETIETQKPISKMKEEILRDFLAAKDAGDDEKAWEVLSKNRDLGSGKLIPLQLAFLFVDSKLLGEISSSEMYLDAMVYAGNLEERQAGDLLWKHLAAFYQRITNGELLKIKKAQNLMTSSAKLRLEGKLNTSLQGFLEAKGLFVISQNFAYSKICDNWIATLLFQLGKLGKSNQMFTDLAIFCENRNYKWLATQAYVRLTYGVSSQNRYSKSIEYNLKALKIAEQTNDIFNFRRIYASLADEYRNLGQYDASLSLIGKSLLLDDSFSLSTQRWETLEALTNIFITVGLPHVSILCQNEALEIAKATQNAGNEQLSLMYLGQLYLFVEDFAKSRVFFEASVEKIKEFETTEVRDKAFAFNNLKLADLERITSNFDKSIELYQYSADFYSDAEFKLHNYESHKGLLLSYIKKNNDIGVQNEFPIIFDIFAKYRKEIIEEQNRNSFFDNEQGVYDIATEYEFEKSNFVSAFDYAEESRSRSLLDLQNSVGQVSSEEKQPEIKFSANLSKPLKLSQIQSEMPENTELLVYSVMSEKVLIWAITKNSLNMAKSEISAETLLEKTTNYVELVSKNQDPSEQLKLSKELYQTLISPIKNKLDSQKQIVIIPDKILFRLPFATLYSDKYFLEDYNISYSPSANVFLNCTKKAIDLAKKPLENLLSVGNPKFNQNEYGNSLQMLPVAKDEATEIAKLYANPKVLVENEATKDRVKENLQNADVFHFAGHYLVEEKTPLLSSFVLAGGKKSNLANHEIISEKLSHTRLIVLSACDTEIETFYNGEGMIGASRTFLAINVPLVVASQWSVDSEATKDMMIRFHQLRKSENLTTAMALRQSQLEMLKNERFKQPYYWAAFAAIGGITRF